MGKREIRHEEEGRYVRINNPSVSPFSSFPFFLARTALHSAEQSPGAPFRRLALTSRVIDSVWFLLAIAAILRIGVLAAMPDALSADPDGYRRLAQNVLEHGVFGQGAVSTAYRPPAYPLLLVPSVALGTGSQFGIGALHVVLGVATVGLTFVLARRAGLSDGWAVLAGGLVAVDPILLMQSALVMSETLAALLVVLAVWLLDRCTRRPTAGNAAVAGAALGAVVLCRPGLLAFAAAAAVLLPWLVAQARNAEGERDSEEEKRERGEAGKLPVGRRWRGAGQVLAGFLAGLVVTVSPWVARNQVVIGRPLVATTHGGYTLLLGTNPFFYEHLHRGQWFQAWDAEPFHAWWRRELLADDLLVDGGLSQFSRQAEPLPAEPPPRRENGTVPFASAGATELRKDASPPLVFRSPEAELRADAMAYRHAFASISAQPGMFVRSCLVRAGRFWSPLPFQVSPHESPLRRDARWGVGAWYLGMFTLAATGIIGIFLGSRVRRTVFVWSLLVALTLTAVHTFYWSNLRMRAPLMPLVAIAAVEGVTRLQRRRMRM